jgi:hypothetical protein
VGVSSSNDYRYDLDIRRDFKGMRILRAVSVGE